MNGGSIWWGQIGTSLQFLKEATNCLRDCRTAVLQVPLRFPWRQKFYEEIDLRRASFSGERRLVRLKWDDTATDPGEFVLTELCSAKVCAEYWPGLTYAAYLASKDEIVLNDCYVWITGIHNKSDLSKWVNFTTEYVRLSQHPDQRAVFILEYDGATADVSGMEKITYSVESYDCRVFALEAAATLANTDSRNYQAELALSICGNDPEFCFALLMRGIKLLQNPIGTTADVIASDISSESLSFAAMSEQQINSAAWEASIILLFPVLERYRMGFISRNDSKLSYHLPICNSNGDQITEPCDLEIGSLYYIVNVAGKSFSEAEFECVRLCRKVRNLLAHNKVLPYEDVQKVLAL